MMVLLGGERRNIETSLTCGEPPAKTRENHHKARHGGEGGNGSITTYDSQVKFYTGCNPRNGTIENAIRQPFIDVSCAKANPSVFLSLFLSFSLSTSSYAGHFPARRVFHSLLSCRARPSQSASQPAIDRSSPAIWRVQLALGDSPKRDACCTTRYENVLRVSTTSDQGCFMFSALIEGGGLDLSPRRIEFSTLFRQRSRSTWPGLFCFSKFSDTRDCLVIDGVFAAFAEQTQSRNEIYC